MYGSHLTLTVLSRFYTSATAVPGILYRICYFVPCILLPCEEQFSGQVLGERQTCHRAQEAAKLLAFDQVGWVG